MLNDVKDKKENQMMLLLGDNKVIKCPTCNIPYSIFRRSQLTNLKILIMQKALYKCSFPK
jgi:hypothetical protein